MNNKEMQKMRDKLEAVLARLEKWEKTERGRRLKKEIQLFLKDTK
jgi:hypothetical protein